MADVVGGVVVTMTVTVPTSTRMPISRALRT
jgi:hypothetical protein